jgi:hypothetical protein
MQTCDAFAGSAAADVKLVYAQINSALASGNAVQRATAVRQIAPVLRQGTHYDCPTRLRYRWLPERSLHIAGSMGRNIPIQAFIVLGNFAL